MFERYKNLGGNSSVVAFECGLRHLAVIFGGGKQMYVYTEQRIGLSKFKELTLRAKEGHGLGSGISSFCYTDYSHVLIRIGGNGSHSLPGVEGRCHIKIRDRESRDTHYANALSESEATRRVKEKAGLPADLTLLPGFYRMVWTPKPIPDSEAIRLLNGDDAIVGKEDR